MYIDHHVHYTWYLATHPPGILPYQAHPRPPVLYPYSSYIDLGLGSSGTSGAVFASLPRFVIVLQMTLCP
jgi:hypothetical protein